MAGRRAPIFRLVFLAALVSLLTFAMPGIAGDLGFAVAGSAWVIDA